MGSRPATRGEVEREHGTGTSTFWCRTQNNKRERLTDSGLDLVSLQLWSIRTVYSRRCIGKCRNVVLPTLTQRKYRTLKVTFSINKTWSACLSDCCKETKGVSGNRENTGWWVTDKRWFVCFFSNWETKGNLLLTCRNNLSESRSRGQMRNCCSGRRMRRVRVRKYGVDRLDMCEGCNTVEKWLTCTCLQLSAWWFLTCEVWVLQPGWCLREKWVTDQRQDFRSTDFNVQIMRRHN